MVSGGKTVRDLKTNSGQSLISEAVIKCFFFTHDIAHYRVTHWDGACSAVATMPSHVLASLGVPLEYVHGSVRLTLSHTTDRALFNDTDRTSDIATDGWNYSISSLGLCFRPY